MEMPKWLRTIIYGPELSRPSSTPLRGSWEVKGGNRHPRVEFVPLTPDHGVVKSSPRYPHRRRIVLAESTQGLD